jgi:putative glycosyltransferase (TIGR04372 family)
MKKFFKRIIESFDPSLKTSRSLTILFITMSFLAGFFIFLIQRLASPFIRIRINRINSLRVGHMLLEIDWYLSHPQSKSIDFFFFSTPKPVNVFLADFAKQRINFLSKNLLFGTYILNRVAPGGNKYIVDLPTEPIDFQLFDQTPSPFIFTPDFETKGKELMGNLGISLSSPIVCFYIRDRGYATKQFPYQNQDIYSYRDSSVHDFVPAMEYLTTQGYTVIRMGRESDTQINSSNSKIIDYCFSSFKSDFADFYLISKAKFAICTDSGTTHFPFFFRKPISHVNIAGLHGLLHTKLVKFVIFKRYFDLHKNRDLTLTEILNSELAKFKDSYKFANNGIKFLDSTSDEIVGLVTQMHVNCHTSECTKIVLTDQNKEFQEMISRHRGIHLWSQIPKIWLDNNKNFLK